MTTSHEIKGLRQLVKRLRGMRRRVAGPICVKAITAGMRVAVRSIEAFMRPAFKGTVGCRIYARQYPSIMRGIVGIHVGMNAAHGTRWSAASVVGTQPRFRKTRSGKLASTGRIVGNDAVNRGMSACAGQVQSVVRSVLKNEIANMNR